MWNPFGASVGGVGLNVGHADAIGMLETVLVICKPHPGAGPGPLGGWPALVETAAEVAYMPDSADDVPRPRPWTVTTDIADEVLLENDLIRIWRFELDAHRGCHAHQHVCQLTCPGLKQRRFWPQQVSALTAELRAT